MAIVFFIFTGVKTAKTKGLIDESETIKTEIDTDYLLIEFLKQKTGNPNAENMAELIRLYYKTRDTSFHRAHQCKYTNKDYQE